jgi:hypothetical protein
MYIAKESDKMLHMHIQTLNYKSHSFQTLQFILWILECCMSSDCIKMTAGKGKEHFSTSGSAKQQEPAISTPHMWETAG